MPLEVADHLGALALVDGHRLSDIERIEEAVGRTREIHRGQIVRHVFGQLQGRVVEEIAGKIERNGGDYVLAVKENQPALHDALKRNLDEMILENFAGVRHDFVQTVDGDHGRIETRRVWVTNQLDDWLAAGQRNRWPALKSVAVVEAKREVPLKPTSVERRYFISSVSGADAPRMADIIRGHWSVENKLHWVLDVSFAEDQARQRKDHSAENFSRLRRIALNLLQRETSKKRGVKGKRLNAAWDHDYLLKLLAG